MAAKSLSPLRHSGNLKTPAPNLSIDLGPRWCQVGAMPTVRRNVYLSEPQDAYLAAEAERLGISITELLRRIVDQHREKEAANTKPRKASK